MANINSTATWYLQSQAGASRVTHLTVRKGQLYGMGEPVDAVEMKDALQKFVNWIKAKNKKVDLFAHNANAFDSK